jgi:uncharacterized protein
MNARAAHRFRLGAVAALILVSAGCARVFGSYDIAPSGLPAGEDRLRQMLSAGEAGGALERLDRRPPDDLVLHALYDGVLAYHAGDYRRSAEILDAAGFLADDRITKSVSRAALSLVSNDLVLPYEPGRTERLMIPYYAALARTRMGDHQGAAVEARRLSLLLQQYGDAGDGPDAALAATLHMVAAAMFEAAGDRSAADVAYRNAVAHDSTLSRGPATDSTGIAYVIVEQGFVAHRVEQGLAVVLLPDEVSALAHGSTDERGLASGFVAARILEYATAGRADWRGGTLFVPPPERSRLPVSRPRTTCRSGDATAAATDTTPAARRANGDQPCTKEEEDRTELPYLLRVSWPLLTEGHRTAAAVRLAGATGASASVSRGVAADFEAERNLIVARTIARGAAKLALTKGAEKKLEEQNELAGRLVGLIGNVGNALLERADTRSWHLLPASVTVLRVELAAGEHTLPLEVGGRTMAVDGVRVPSGGAVVVPVRSWGGGAGP